MTKVDLITRHAIRNYGSVLQTVATKELLRNQGARARIVDYRQPGYDDTGWSYANRGSVRDYPLPLKAAYAALRSSGVKRIGTVFEAFIASELLLTSERYRSIDSLTQSTEFDPQTKYLVGSDQVWNLDYNIDNSPYYLDFAPSGSFKFSFASSLGMDKLPPVEERKFVDALSTFKGVSVRETSSVDYLASLGIDAFCHVDPTLAIAPEFWESFAATPAHTEPYILVYQLNGGSDVLSAASHAAHNLGLPVKRVEYWRGPRAIGNKCAILPTPQEFVGLFRDATCVITDSFHGTVFSTVFGRPFVAVPPPRYSQRLSSLLELLDQSHRMPSDIRSTEELLLTSSVSMATSLKLQQMRSEASIYLNRMVNG